MKSVYDGRKPEPPYPTPDDINDLRERVERLRRLVIAYEALPHYDHIRSSYWADSEVELTELDNAKDECNEYDDILG